METENNKEEYSPYCSKCDSCGEDGCCSAISCTMDGGEYCSTYLKDLRFGYLLSKDLYNLISKDEKYKEMVDKIYDKNYEIIYGK